MNKTIFAVLLSVSACGKKKEAALIEKMDAPAVGVALADTVAGQPAAPAEAFPGDVPPWARENPRFFERDGRRFASAVGRVRVTDPALARSAAEDRARVELLKLIDGTAGTGTSTGALPGARMTDSFTSANGEVFIRVEVAAPQKP